MSRMRQMIVLRDRLVIVRHRPTDFPPDDHLRGVVAGDRLGRLVGILIGVTMMIPPTGALDDRVVITTAQGPIFDFFGAVERGHAMFGAGLFERAEPVAATAFQDGGSVTRLGRNVAPAGVAGDHEWF